MLRCRWPILLAACLACAQPAAGEDRVTVVSWGGAYEAAQRHALFAPYTAASGTDVEVLVYAGGIDALAQRAAPEGWQVVDMLERDAIAACDAGLLHRLDHETLVEPAGALSVSADFAPASLFDCSIPQNVFAIVMAYDDRAYPGVKPTRVEDFFDLERFPGKRAVEENPTAILEWALMAEGVPPRQVYDLLSTDRGLRLAFSKLDEIRDAIVWWHDPAEAAAMLQDGRATMASGYNGRFFSAAKRDKAPIVVVWDGRLIGYDVWAVPATADPDGAAADFLRFAVRPEQMARLASWIPYGPARHSAFERIGLHAELGIPMRSYLPNAPWREDRALSMESVWYANTHDMRQRRFEQWRDGVPTQ